MQSKCDIAIVGAGPAGLAAAVLADMAGFAVQVVEKEPEAGLVAPLPDGRDIALTHRSVAILQRIGVWDLISDADKSPIRRASVLNSASGELLDLPAGQVGHEALGTLVPNNVIRRTLYERVKSCPRVSLDGGVAVTALELGAAAATLSLSRGNPLSARLAIAADSRFSETRRKAGIGAEMKDFGRVCIVCRMRHELAHDQTAIEWFDDDRTLAALPLNGSQSSIVLTVDASMAPALLALDPALFAADIERRFARRWGGMTLIGERYAYPLVAVYAASFHGRRFALAGDAAVGMHPVTAHGFNFGLQGAVTLIDTVAGAARTGLDIGCEAVLERFGREHRYATWPLFTATNAIVGLYTDNRPLARMAREGLLRLGNVLSPVKSLLIHKLTEAGEDPALAG